MKELKTPVGTTYYVGPEGAVKELEVSHLVGESEACLISVEHPGERVEMVQVLEFHMSADRVQQLGEALTEIANKMREASGG